MEAPLIQASPASGSRKPAIMRSVVDLPALVGPHEGDGLALGDGEAHAANCAARAEDLGEIVDLQHFHR